jgi:hypothetical protein
MSLRNLLGCNNIAHLARHIVAAKWSETSGGAGLYWCEYDGIHFFVKLMPYDHLEIDGHKPTPANLGLCHPVDAEINILRAIKTRIIDRGFCPHIIEILAAYRCPGVSRLFKAKECEDRVYEREVADEMPPTILCLYNEQIKRGVAHDRVALAFYEQCDLSLTDFIARFLPVHPSEREDVLLATIFQV